jgi:secreted trypsin-like serine protease
MRRLVVLFGLIGSLLVAYVSAAAAGPVVVGGTPAVKGEFPWVVRLSVGCGGALVRPDVVLTAAHCVSGSSGVNTGIMVTAGAVDLAAADAVRVPSAYVYKSPAYVTYDRGDDWALIKLAEPVEVPVLSLVSTNAPDAGPFTIMGWGADREGGDQQRFLLKAQVPAVDDATCGKAYRDSGANFVDDAMLCAGLFGVGGVDTCQGDSGGPMIAHLEDGTDVQVGIVSWGHGCAQPQFPGVYTQLSTYAAEITKALSQLATAG